MVWKISQIVNSEVLLKNIMQNQRKVSINTKEWANEKVFKTGAFLFFVLGKCGSYN